MATQLYSFGFRNGAPPLDADLTTPITIDLRHHTVKIRNPFRIMRLRSCTGLDLAVARYIESGSGFKATYQAIRDLVAATEGPVWIGCVGGRHRSVYLADRLGKELGIPVTHRDLPKVYTVKEHTHGV